MAATLDEKAPLPDTLSFWSLVWDNARVTQSVVDHQYPGSGTQDDPFVVTWIPNDPGSPLNLSTATRWLAALVAALTTLAVTLNSSTFSGALRQYNSTFHASETVITLGVSLFVLGFALGPLLWSPFSEVKGRRLTVFLSYGTFTIFNGAAIASKNIETMLVLRFLAGACGSAPLTVGGGIISDLFTVAERGLAMGTFALAPFLGPALGPLCGGFIGEAGGWKWVQGFLTILSGVLWIIGILLVPETFAPVLLKARARKLSQMTGHVYKSQLEITQKGLSTAKVFSTSLSRPLVLLVAEPIVLLISIYMAIVYGTLYLLFGAYPIVFQLHRGWSEGTSGLAFIGIAIGMLLAWLTALADGFYYQQSLRRSATGYLPPEQRLFVAMVGAVALPVGMFWFAWTCEPSVHWMSPVAAGVPFGFGMVLVFVASANYLVDVYTLYSASVLAANSVLRSLFGFAFPLFTPQMFRRLGLQWAASVPAFLALACVPIPFLFYRYGAQIRRRCKYASESETFVEQRLEMAASAHAKQRDSDSEDVESGGLERVPTVQDAYESAPFDIDRVHTATSQLAQRR